MVDEQYHPMVFFWLAIYKDGTSLPQFDFETGILHEFKEIEQDRLDKFGLVPFNVSLAIKACKAAGFRIAIVREGLPFLILKLVKDQRLIYYRRGYIHQFDIDHCEKCNYKWQWMATHKEGEISEVGLPIHPQYVLQEFQGKKFPLVQCPKCGSYNAILCPDCGTLINEMERKDTKEHYFMCPKCKKEFQRHIKLLHDTMRKTIYLLGHQTTVDGKNIKNIMFINENGIIELSENFEYK